MWLRTDTNIKWKNRFRFTIQSDRIDSDLIDFPLLLNLSTTSGINQKNLANVFGVLGNDSNRKKIAITIGESNAQCFVEIQEWRTIFKKAILWVKCPIILSPEENTFYFYYDRNIEDNIEYIGDFGSSIAHSIWDSNYIGVWHMNQAPSGGPNCILDSTSNGINGTPSGAFTSSGSTEGVLGKGINFNGNDVINFGKDSRLNNIDEKTFEIIGVPSNWGEIGYGRLYDKNRNYLQLSYAGSRVRALQYYGDDLVEFYAQNDTIETGHGTGVSVKFNNLNPANFPKMFVNGPDQNVIRNGASSNVRSDDNSYNLLIGNRNDLSRGYRGTIDEIRLSKSIRSNAWSKASIHSSLDDLLEFDHVTDEYDLFSVWNNHIKFKIDHSRISEDLYNFPVRVNISSSSGITDLDLSGFFDEMGELDKKKIAISQDEHNQLFVEIQQWDIINKSIQLWFKIPHLHKDQETFFYLFYDNTQIDNDTYVGTIGSSAAQQVWDSNFIAVYHFQETTGQLLDSTSNGLDSIIITNFSESQRTNQGPIGNCYKFEGAQSITMPNVSNFRPNEISIEVLCKISAGNVDWARIIDRMYYPYYGYALGINTTGKVYFHMIDTAVVSNAIASSIITEGDGKWHNYGSSFDKSLTSNNCRIVVDATLDSNKTTHLNIRNYEWEHLMFGYGWIHKSYYKGEMCEVRLSNVPRSDNWLITTKYSNNDELFTYYPPNEQYSISGQTTRTGSPISASIRLYRRTDGTLQDEIVSDPISGNYLINEIDHGDEYFTLVSFDGNDLKALVRDKVLPTVG